jgi:hypothetical protein
VTEFSNLVDYRSGAGGGIRTHEAQRTNSFLGPYLAADLEVQRPYAHLRWTLSPYLARLPRRHLNPCLLQILSLQSKMGSDLLDASNVLTLEYQTVGAGGSSQYLCCILAVRPLNHVHSIASSRASGLAYQRNLSPT